MVISPSDIPAVLMERIEFAYPGPALFWQQKPMSGPPEFSSTLLVEVFYDRHLARTLCAVRAATGTVTSPLWFARQKRGGLAFIACDEEPDHGRVSVALQSLAQHTATLAGIAFLISELMALGPPRSSVSGAVFKLGTISGRHGHRDVSIGLDDGRLTIRVGRQRESVIAHSALDWRWRHRATWPTFGALLAGRKRQKPQG